MSGYNVIEMRLYAWLHNTNYWTHRAGWSRTSNQYHHILSVRSIQYALVSKYANYECIFNSIPISETCLFRNVYYPVVKVYGRQSNYYSDYGYKHYILSQIINNAISNRIVVMLYEK